MGENKDYNPDVYRRLELVQKQFKTNTADQKRRQAAEKRQAWSEYLRKNKVSISRFALYAVMGLILTAVIVVVIIDKI
jgi:hypothetical protein